MDPLLRLALIAVATTVVIVATIPVFAGLFQFLAVAFSMFFSNLERTADYAPRLAVLIPAWNEEAVIGTTIDRLMKLDYPRDRLRVYIVDDASTDGTPDVILGRRARYGHQVVHVRRHKGGEGKAHTLNHGLRELWAEDWAESVLIMDADVIYTASSLKRMARHLADPTVGAITAYIKEGSRKPTYVQRFVTFEYITATGASRRAQNVFGFLACLSGGAQLHSKQNLKDQGGTIFTDTLAEDTFTTFRTQLNGRRAIFEPNAVVYAEEPADLTMLWKQRLRWARGNVQITSVFRRLWLNPSIHESLGGTSMAFLWFSIFLMPVFQIGAAVSLWVLYFVDPELSWTLFRGYWIIAALVYLLVTFTSFVVDPESAVKSWAEGFLFPGLISLAVIVYSLWPPPFDVFLGWLDLGDGVRACGTLFLYAWLALAMPLSYFASVLERSERWKWLAAPTLYVSGYGAFLCAVTFAAYIKEWQGAARTWDKTVKTGTVG